MRLLLICIAIVGIRIVLDGVLRNVSMGETVSNSFWLPLLRLALVDFVYFSLAAAIALFAYRSKAITSVMLGMASLVTALFVGWHLATSTVHFSSGLGFIAACMPYVGSFLGIVFGWCVARLAVVRNLHSSKR